MNWLDAYRDKLSPYLFAEWPDGALLCGDSLKVMPLLGEKCADLLLTDPPYGINVIPNEIGHIGGSNLTAVNTYRQIIGDQKMVDLRSCFPVSQNQIIFGGNYFNLPISRGWIVWDKKGKNDWWDNFSDGELAWTSFDVPLRIFRWLYMGCVRKGQNGSGNRVHPAQKPIELFVWILEHFSSVPALILDPFLGSGTTAIAALRTGRRFIGIEISEEYCQIAKQRIDDEYVKLKQEARQLDMFAQAAGD